MNNWIIAVVAVIVVAVVWFGYSFKKETVQNTNETNTIMATTTDNVIDENQTVSTGDETNQ